MSKETKPTSTVRDSDIAQGSLAPYGGFPTKGEVRVRRVLATAALVGIGFLGGRATGIIGGGSAAPEGKFGDVPEATIQYLESLPTQPGTIPEGGGADNAAYQVDPTTYDDSTNIHDGIRAIINAQVPHNQGTPIPQAGERVNVPVVPELGSVPSDAR